MPLGNLENLRKFRAIGGGKYQACCPAHDDKGPSLAIREMDDGRILLHCFAGCEVPSILDACGMTFADIMPLTQSHHLRPVKAPFPASQGIQTLWLEAMIVIDCARQVHAGKRLSKPDRDRLWQCIDKINEVSQLCIRT